MRTWLLMILVALCLSCEDNIEFNSPALQGDKDGEFWKSLSQEAIKSTGIIIGTSNGETITLDLETPLAIGVDSLGAGRTSKAYFTKADGTTYSTLFSALDNPDTPEDESVLYYSEGTIEITDVNTVEGYISGAFWFTAYDSLGVNRVNFNEGVFYQVPFTTE